MFSGILIGSSVFAQLCCSRYSCHFLLVKATTNYQCSTLLTSARFHWHQPSGDVDLPQSLLTHTSQHPNCLSIGSSVPDFHVPIVEPPVSHTAIYYWHISRLASRRDSAERQSSFQIIMFWDQLRPRDVAYHYLTAFLVYVSVTAVATYKSDHKRRRLCRCVTSLLFQKVLSSEPTSKSRSHKYRLSTCNSRARSSTRVCRKPAKLLEMFFTVISLKNVLLAS